MQIQIDPILLSKVQKPARYVGGEWNSVVKNHNDVDFTVAYCFPDVYEVAMSHLGPVSYTHLTLPTNSRV